MVAMETYIFHRIIMGKVEIDKKNSDSMIFGFFYRNAYKIVLFVTFFQIAEFDWLSGRLKEWFYYKC